MQSIDELMLEHFGAVWPEEHEWTNVHDGQHTKVECLAALIARYINAAEVFIRVNYENGVRIPTSEAAGYVAPHVLTGIIEIADTEFTGFVFIATPGVATGWRSLLEQAKSDGA